MKKVRLEFGTMTSQGSGVTVIEKAVNWWVQAVMLVYGEAQVY